MREKKISKKILSLFIALVMLLCLTPVTAFAMDISIDLTIIGEANLTLEVEPTDRIEDIRLMIQEKTDIPVKEQILIFAGMELEDGNTLQDYTIQKDSTLVLQMKPGKSITLGTSVINSYDKDTDKADAIYYGVYTKDGEYYDVPWYVLGFDTLKNTGFMLSKYTLGTSVFRSSGNYGPYSGSTLEAVMNDLYSGVNSLFTSTEQGAIKGTTLSRVSMDNNGSDITGAHLFPIWGDDTTDLKDGGNIMIANDIILGNASEWWFRYSITDNQAVYIKSNGYSDFDLTSKNFGVRPAFNLNLNSVLFTSLISTTDTGSEYKLTLIDDNMDISKPNGSNATRCGNTLTIPYTISGSDSAIASQVSVLVLDKEYTVGNTNRANVLAYGKLNTKNFSTTGSGTFTLPDTLSGKTPGTDCHIYILAEDINGTYETDYASTPLEISYTWESAKAPTASIENGTYTENQNVGLTSATEGASIYYTIDGTDPSFDQEGNPTGTTRLYSNAISVAGEQGNSLSTTIKAIVVKSGMASSSISEFTYVITLKDTTNTKPTTTDNAISNTGKPATTDNAASNTGKSGAADNVASNTGKSVAADNAASNTGKSVAADNTKYPQTSDNGHIFFWIVLFLVCVGAVIATRLAGKKRKYSI